MRSLPGVLSMLLLLALRVDAQQTGPARPSQLTIHLEQLRGEHTIPVRPEHVFEHDDVVRFRINSSVDGYLYAVDQGSSGQYSVLFPSASSSTGNAVAKQTELFVPASEDGWFQIDGPAGFETVYFLVSPTKLNVSAGENHGTTKPSPSAAPRPSLMPRCNDAIFQARGECVDDSAGAAVLPRDAPLPPQITAAAPNASRDLILTHDGDGTVKVTPPGAGPAVYVFRLAHK